ncbi:hypothetical protein ACFWYW_42350 [Nonomuraea sp. NPDC059023]|uniref:hypothetical protein n=1 Tax=unclassified Nonomuraea TaxID=2593643 RepID=UPI0036B84DB5
MFDALPFMQAHETELQAAATEEGDRAHRRLGQMHAFYNFLLGELPALLDRRHRQRR